ncbi:hypothetical protein [Glycomyces buryatensis]|uniref:Transposase n=1 Tax=Glycomyces buryatensis TaxID=2570927 RepID=A0A4S8QHL1_9ACTN|nr:hypothetical protein [Glycomyces buryatensis]THV42722.1 hypothetical protein FAB82_04875 [Glycomyces buryatensis]
MSARPRRIDFREGVDPGRLKDRIDFLEKKMAELLGCLNEVEQRVEDQENEIYSLQEPMQKGARSQRTPLPLNERKQQLKEATRSTEPRSKNSIKRKASNQN